jgi:PAS domain-containing protein
MKRFICEQNVAHFRKLLGGTHDPARARTLERLLATELRALAMIESEQFGAATEPRRGRQQQPLDASAIRQAFLADFERSPHPYLLLDPGPGLHIVDVNAAYAAATFTERDGIVGQSLFDVFPDDPDQPFADGVSNLYASLKTVAKTGQPHAMSVQRYDIRDPSGQFVERHWQPINTPVHDAGGRLAFLLHHVEDVTHHVGRRI